MSQYITIYFDEDYGTPSADEVLFSYIRSRLIANDWDVCKTAKEIKIGKSTIYRHIKNGQIKSPVIS